MKIKKALIIIALVVLAVFVQNKVLTGNMRYWDFDQKYGTDLSSFHEVYGGDYLITRYGFRYKYTLIDDDLNYVYLYFSEGKQVEEPFRLRNAMVLLNSITQTIEDGELRIDLYEFTDVPKNDEYFTAILYARYSNEKGSFLLEYYPEKLPTEDITENSYRYDGTDRIHDRDLEIIEGFISKF